MPCAALCRVPPPRPLSAMPSPLLAQGAQSPAQQAQALEQLLATIGRTRQALPALVRTVLPPASVGQPPAPADRAAQYRAASHECHAAVRTLAEQLQAAEATLNGTAESEKRDPNDIVVRPAAATTVRAPAQEQTQTDGASKTQLSWDKVGEILAAGGRATPSSGHPRGGSPSQEPFVSQHPVPESPEQLEQLLSAWNNTHARANVRTGRTRRGRPVELLFTLKGVLRARISLRWGSGEGREADRPGRCEADYVVCYGLREEVRRQRSFRVRDTSFD